MIPSNPPNFMSFDYLNIESLSKKKHQGCHFDEYQIIRMFGKLSISKVLYYECLDVTLWVLQHVSFSSVQGKTSVVSLIES